MTNVVYNQYNTPGRAVRFWEKVGPPGGCWIWQGAHIPDGYGSFMDEGQAKKAHRVAWELVVGPISDGMHVLHHCDVRDCVRPTHLFLGTNADNVADRVAKGRDYDRRGPKNSNTKLTAEDVRWIRAYVADGVDRGVIADSFGIDRSTVNRIARGTTWQNV